MGEIRPFQQDQWNILLDVANQVVPFASQENVEWLEYRKAFNDTKFIRRHYIAIENARTVGYGCIEQQSEDPKNFRIFIVCHPENLRTQVGNKLFEKLRQDAVELGVTHLWAREFQKDEPIRVFFIERGFVETKRFTLPGQLPMAIYTLDLSD